MIWAILANYKGTIPYERLVSMIAVEVQTALDAAAPKAAPSDQAHALCSILTEIVTTLGFQPSVPLDHKTDLMNALTEFKHAFGIK